MKRIAVLFLAITVQISLLAQEQEQAERIYSEYDFSNVDAESVDRRKILQQMDSIWRTSGGDSLARLVRYVDENTYTASYISFDIGYEATFASLSQLNDELRAMGFNEISGTFGSIPWGFSMKGNRWLFTYLFAPGIKNQVSNDDYNIEVKGMSLDLALGYDLINLRRFQLYPQIRFGYQELGINVIRKGAARDITNLSGMLLNRAETDIQKNAGLFTYGFEADYHLAYTKGSGGIIIALKYGLNSEFSPSWKINKKKSAYDSSDTLRESSFAVVLRFYGK